MIIILKVVLKHLCIAGVLNYASRYLFPSLNIEVFATYFVVLSAFYMYLTQISLLAYINFIKKSENDIKLLNELLTKGEKK